MERAKIVICGYSSLDSIIITEELLGVGKTSAVRYFAGLKNPLWGGCACNIAVGCAKLGLRSLLITVLGDDLEGREYFNYLKAAGVDVRFVWVRERSLTPRTFLISDASREHMTLFYSGAPVSDQMLDVLNRLRDEDIHLGVLTVGDPRLTRIFVSILEDKGIPLLWSFKADPKAIPQTLVKEIALKCNILVANKNEINFILQKTHCKNVIDLLNSGVKNVIITYGQHGCEVWSESRHEKIPSVPPKKVIDTTGAGDGFVVGLVFGLVNQLSIFEAARIGVTSASFVLEGWGAQSKLPELGELRNRYVQWFGPWPLREER